jgi:hypothetical protein
MTDRGGSAVPEQSDSTRGTGSGDARRDGRDPTVATAVVVPFPVRRPVPADGTGRPAAPPSGAFTVDCAECAHRHTDVCDDCVVSFIVGREPDDALVVDAAEARAVRLLEQAGLVPGVRHEARASGE